MVMDWPDQFFRIIVLTFATTIGSTDIKGDEPFLENGSETVLHVDSLGHALHVFINKKLAGDWN